MTYERIETLPATNFDFSSSIFCDAEVQIFQDRQKPFSEFQQPDAAIETSVEFWYEFSLKSCLYST